VKRDKDGLFCFLHSRSYESRRRVHEGFTRKPDAIRHYQKIVAALAEATALMEEIDETIEEYGGWPIE
jgi:hypothetical protein